MSDGRAIAGRPQSARRHTESWQVLSESALPAEIPDAAEGLEAQFADCADATSQGMPITAPANEGAAESPQEMRSSPEDMSPHAVRDKQLADQVAQATRNRQQATSISSVASNANSSLLRPGKLSGSRIMRFEAMAEGSGRSRSRSKERRKSHLRAHPTSPPQSRLQASHSGAPRYDVQPSQPAGLVSR